MRILQKQLKLLSPELNAMQSTIDLSINMDQMDVLLVTDDDEIK